MLRGMLEKAISRHTKALSAKIQQRFFLSVCIILARPLARLVSLDCQSPGGGLASASSPHQKGEGQYGLGSKIQTAAQRVHTSGSNPTRTNAPARIRGRVLGQTTPTRPHRCG